MRGLRIGEGDRPEAGGGASGAGGSREDTKALVREAEAGMEEMSQTIREEGGEICVPAK